MTKKYRGYAIGFMAGIIVTTTTSVYAAVGDKAEAIFTDFKFMVNGKSILLDQTPVVIDGSSYLPVKSISQALGYNVNYDNSTRTINLNNQVATVNTAVSDNSSTVEDKQVYYLWNDFYSKYHLISGTKFIDNELKNKVTYNDVDYVIQNSSDYYYDRKTDRIYYSEKFLFNFLTKDNLSGLSQYNIDFQNNIVTTLNKSN